MKKLLLVLVMTIVPQVQAAEYFCSDESGLGWVRLISEPGGSELTYGKFDSEIIRQNLPDGVIEVGALDRISFKYSPPGAVLGETVRQIYGRISNGKGLFDIYQFGMLGDIEEVIEDSQCQVFQ